MASDTQAPASRAVLTREGVRRLGPALQRAYRFRSIHSLSLPLGSAPSCLSATLPSLNSRSVGIACTPYFVGVELGDGQPTLEFLREFLERRADHLAGTAPFGPEIDEHRGGGGEDVGREGSVGDFGCGHPGMLLAVRGGTPLMPED